MNNNIDRAVKSFIEKEKSERILKFGEDEDYEIYNTIKVEDYLRNQDLDKTTDIDCKRMIFKFAKKYMYKDLYAVEGVLNDFLYLLIEKPRKVVLYIWMHFYKLLIYS